MTNRPKVAILGGSFNPVTLGHLQCARYVIDNTDVEQAWLTPCFSHMWNKELLPPYHRYVMCLLSTNIMDDITAFNFEINNKITTGTFDFLSLLLARYPEIDFSYFRFKNIPFLF
jgi:nicotinate-nucleotide adenylyltransferase